MKTKILSIKERLLRNPKVFYIAALFLFAATVVLISCGSYDSNRHQYDPENKIVLSNFVEKPDYSDAYMPNPEIPDAYFPRWITASCDVILTGKVLTDGQEGIMRVGYDRQFAMTYTDFTVRVRDVWFGETYENEKTITLRVEGGLDSSVTKPQKGDELVLFLALDVYLDSYSDYILLEEGSPTHWYAHSPSGSEQGILAINPPDDTLYSFSDHPVMSSFDGKDPETLKSAIEDATQSLLTIDLQEGETLMYDEYLFDIGEIGAEYLGDNYTPYVPPNQNEEETE